VERSTSSDADNRPASYRSFHPLRNAKIHEPTTDLRPECFHISPLYINISPHFNTGRTIAQAVSRRLPTVTAWVRAQVRSCGICGGQSGTGAGFLQVLRFPLPILIPPTAPHSSSIIRDWYNRPISGRRTKWTQSHPTPRN
jgi:hypothetical protein